MRPDEADRARKHARRRAALEALRSGAAWDRFVARTRRELARTRPEGWTGLIARLTEARDPAARREAVGAVLDALERARAAGS